MHFTECNTVEPLIVDLLSGPQPVICRVQREDRAEEITFLTPGGVANHLLRRVYTPFDRFDQEELWPLRFNTRNRLAREVMVYRGTVNTVRVRLAEVFKEAVRTNTASIVTSA